MVQKLILGVLTLILVCMVVLIAQNRSKEKAAVGAMDRIVEPAPALAEPEELPAPKPSPPPSRPVLAAPAPKSLAPPAVESTATFPITQPQPPPVTVPEPYTALVNPVARTPLDIVVRPEGQVLKTELCGRVRLEGKPPPEVPINLHGICRDLRDKPLTTRHYVVGPNGGLANVLVYIKEGLPNHYSPPATTNTLIRAEACLFEPYVAGVQTGQKFTIQNTDSVLHNVHATAKNNRNFNVALNLRRSKVQQSFENPEVFIRFKCDLHPWEFSYIGVVPHPFFSVTDTNGVFCLPPGLPHGRYVLAAAHPKAGETLQQIIVQEDNLNVIELAFTVRR
jgi:plastocyanin